MLGGHFSALQVVISGWCSRAQYHSCPIHERNLEKCIATFYSAQQTVNMHTAKSTAKKSHSKAWNHQCRCTQSCMSRQFTSHHKIMELYFSAEWETGYSSSSNLAIRLDPAPSLLLLYTSILHQFQVSSQSKSTSSHLNKCFFRWMFSPGILLHRLYGLIPNIWCHSINKWDPVSPCRKANSLFIYGIRRHSVWI